MLTAAWAAAEASGIQKDDDLLEVVFGDGGQAGAEVLVGSSLVDKHGFGVGDGAAGNAAVIEAGDHTEHLVAGILHAARKHHAAERGLGFDQLSMSLVAVHAEDAHSGVISDRGSDAGKVVVDAECEAVVCGQEDFDFGIGGVEVLSGGHAGIGILVLELDFLGELGLLGVLLDLDELISLGHAGLGSAAGEDGNGDGVIVSIGIGVVDPLGGKQIQRIGKRGVLSQHAGIGSLNRSNESDNFNAGILCLLHDGSHGFGSDRPDNDFIHTLGNVVFHGGDLRCGVELAVNIAGFPALGFHRGDKAVGQRLEEVTAEAFFGFDQQAAQALEQGYEAYFEAATIEELAEQLGIDPDVLQDTVDQYNEYCRCGVDDQFHKEQKYLHELTGKGHYIVGKFYLGAYGTVGGVRINKYCEVLNDDLLPIEGLYSAGSDANTIYGDSYNFTLPGNTMGFAINTGRMAGESVADYIADLEG